MVDLLTTLQSLFYDPTPFNSMGVLNKVPAIRSRSKAVALERLERVRARATSAERAHYRHIHGGCNACHPRQNSPHGHKIAACLTQGVERWEGAADLHEIVVALEDEIGLASQEYTMQVQRMVGEACRSARVLGQLPGSDPGPSASTSEVVVLAASPLERGVLRTCLDWVEEEYRVREKLGLPKDGLMPTIDWIDERAQYQATTRAMETKFNQLGKLKRALLARQVNERPS